MKMNKIQDKFFVMDGDKNIILIPVELFRAMWKNLTPTEKEALYDSAFKNNTATSAKAILTEYMKGDYNG